MLRNMFNNNNSNSNNNGHHHDQMMGPRISFSSDFMDANQLRYELGTAYKEAPVSSDFEFSVMDAGCGSSLAPADEIFYQGKLLPVDDLGCSDQTRNRMTTTLREELLVGDGGDEPPRRSSGGSGRWMERLGLKKGRRQRSGKSLETVEEEVASQDTTRKQQEALAEGGRQSFRGARG